MNSSSSFGFVKKTGDTMSGNLGMAATKTVDGVDISEIAATLLNMLTGTYTGDNSDDRTIDIGVNLAGMSHVYIIIKSSDAEVPYHRIEHGQGDASMSFIASADIANAIQQFVATGFEIGQLAGVNANGITFRYMVWYVP